MLPLLAIGGVIGAIMSVAKGASWVSDQIGPASGAEATAKSEKQAQTAKAAPFEKALAAQAAGPSVPTRGTIAPAPAAAVPAAGPASAGILAATHGTDYDSLARMQAGIAAYGSVGERHGHHSGQAKPPESGNDPAAPAAGNGSPDGNPAETSTKGQNGLGSLTNL